VLCVVYSFFDVGVYRNNEYNQRSYISCNQFNIWFSDDDIINKPKKGFVKVTHKPSYTHLIEFLHWRHKHLNLEKNKHKARGEDVSKMHAKMSELARLLRLLRKGETIENLMAYEKSKAIHLKKMQDMILEEIGRGV